MQNITGTAVAKSTDRATIKTGVGVKSEKKTHEIVNPFRCTVVTAAATVISVFVPTATKNAAMVSM